MMFMVPFCCCLRDYRYMLQFQIPTQNRSVTVKQIYLNLKIIAAMINAVQTYVRRLLLYFTFQ